MNEFKVGLLALATMAAIVVMSLKVTSNQSGFGDYVTYRTVISDASGIFPKTPIKVAGINAGRIKDISLQGNQAHITFEVLSRIAVPEDSTLKIKTVGFLGDKYLEIYVGSSPTQLKEMGYITSEEGGGIETLVKDASEILKDVKVITNSLKGTISPDGEESPIKQIFEDIKVITANTKVLTSDLKVLIGDNQQKLNEMIENLRRFSEDVAYQVDNANQDSAMRDLKKILANVDRLTDDMKVIVSDIRAGRGTMGKLLVEEEIADEVRETLAGVRKIVTKVDAIRTELSVYSGANTDFGAETRADLKIFPSPERFYLLGVVTSELGPETKTETTTEINGVKTTELRSERKRDTYRFNLQIGRRLHNWSFRGGVIESKGGLGVDYDIPTWGTRFTAEVFDYRDDIGFNYRLSTEFQVWNVIYGRLSGEDLARDERSATISAGLKFNDEDLKGLIGFFF